MPDVYLPAGWPEGVAPPGAEDWEATAVAWLLDSVPDPRTRTMIRMLMKTADYGVLDV
jgi:hypothetical protein